MKNRLISGILFIALGVLIAIGPKIIFPVCGTMGEEFMKCHWTAQAELGIGGLIIILGVLLLLLASKMLRLGIQIAIILQFAEAILIPSVLIGVCEGNHMRCHSLPWPVWNVLGSAGILFGMLNAIYLWKEQKRSQIPDEK